MLHYRWTKSNFQWAITRFRGVLPNRSSYYTTWVIIDMRRTLDPDQGRLADHATAATYPTFDGALRDILTFTGLREDRLGRRPFRDKDLDESGRRRRPHGFWRDASGENPNGSIRSGF